MPRPVSMSVLKIALIVAFSFLTMIACVRSASAQSMAADGLNYMILTEDGEPSRSPEGSMYVIRDPDRKMGFNSIIGMISNKKLADHSFRGHGVSLGSKGEPLWLVIPVINKSERDVWLFHFGSAGNGRIGFASKAILYEPTSRQTFFNTDESENATKTTVYLPSRIPLSLKRGTPSYLIFYLQGRSASVSAFNPSLNRSVMVENIGQIAPQSKTFFIIAALILITGFFFKRDYSFLMLSALWIISYLNRDLVDQTFVISGFSGQLISPAMRLIFPLLLLAAARLVHGSREKYPSSLFIGSALLFMTCGLLGMVLTSVSPVAGTVLTYIPMLGTGLLICMITWPFLMAREGLNFIGIAMIGAITLLNSSFLVLEATGAVRSVEWISWFNPWLLSIASILSAIAHLFFSGDRQGTFRYVDEPELGDNAIREAREASEHKRLLQVLEQERELMKSLQEQETLQKEEMKRAKDSADEANVAKSAFLAVVSHEIRTPMTGIMGMVRLLLDTVLSREQKEYANTIQDSGEALLALLNDILDFEKIESGRLELEDTPFDLKRLLNGIFTLMNGHAASKNIELRLEIDDNLPGFVTGDPTRLRQVLLNLVNNAIKFTSRGNVTIQVRHLSDANNEASNASQIYFGIQDSGIGVSNEAQKKIFTPFSQADSSINRKFGGTGLGLAICKRLIEAMGSSIQIKSREGEGSTFFFTLSMDRASVDSGVTRTAHEISTPTRKFNILVVDDNGINQKVIQGLLGRLGHSSVVASNADEAVEQARATVFDLILMDIELPGRSGVDAAQDIRSFTDPRHAGVAIVAMTGNTGQADILSYLERGMDDFLAKPVMPDILQRLLHKLGSGELSKARPTHPVRAETSDTPPSITASADDKSDSHSINDDVKEDDDDDSFASAVREFEEAERRDENAFGNLDDGLIGSLVGSLGIEQTQSLLGDFYDTTTKLITALEDHFDDRDEKSIKARAHELKGMAANFGFKSLSQVAGEIEKIALNAKEAELQPLLKKLPDLYDASKNEMNARYK